MREDQVECHNSPDDVLGDAGDGVGTRNSKEKSQIILQEYVTSRDIKMTCPSRDICRLAVSTFEKMEVVHLKMIEKLNCDLKAYEKVKLEDVKNLAMRIMTDVWCHDRLLLAHLLEHEDILTKILGQEFIVLFDNVMSDPVYTFTDSGKPQRYTKACLDNSIQPLYGENIPKNGLNNFETVISTYTSPTAFTPEMESLIRTASGLGISTEDYNLTNFVTERSLTAFLKKLIHAKMKKDSFIENFNKKLMGILSHAPNVNDATSLKNNFKYSFSKIYQYSQKNKALNRERPRWKSVTDLNLLRRRTQTSSFNRTDKVQLPLASRKNFPSEDIRKYTHQIVEPMKERPQVLKRYGPCEIICVKCHEPYCGDQRTLVRSLSDSYLSVVSCDSNCCFHGIKGSKTHWTRSTPGDAPVGQFNPYTALAVPKLRVAKKKRELTSMVDPLLRLHTQFCDEQEQGRNFGELTEQRSFFRLGEGALRDDLRDYVEERNARNRNVKKKKVRWSDEQNSSLFTLYGSLMDFNSERVPGNLALKAAEIVEDGPSFSDILKGYRDILPQDFSDSCRSLVLLSKDTSLKEVSRLAVVHATLIAIIFWLSFILYNNTPDIVDKVKQFRFTSIIKE